MSRVTRYLRVGLLLVLLILVGCFPLNVGAATAVLLTPAVSPKVLISEVQMTGASASEEFVELYNATDTDIDFADLSHSGKEPWKLQFFSAANTSNGIPDWSKPSATVSLTETIPARSYYILASTDYAPGGIDSDQAYSSRLSDAGGGLQLVSATTAQTTYYDRLMWKQQASGQTLPAGVIAAPAANGSLQRLPNDDTEYVNSDGTLTDFTLAADITPKDTWHPPVPVDTPDDPAVTLTDPVAGEQDDASDAPMPADDIAVDDAALQPPYLTELLPNPAAPLTDDADEFIELYNPNMSEFDLKGYSLEVGTTTLHDFTFTSDVLLAPLSYTAFYSRDTNLSLSNSGGQGRLIDPAGTVLSESAAYGLAGDNASWSLSGGIWQWSTTTTPDAENTITQPVEATKTTAAAAKTTAKKAVAKTTSTKVKGTTSTKKAKTATKKAAKPKKTQLTAAAEKTDAPSPTPIHTGVLVTVVGLAVLYAAYEYRHDIQNRIHKFRRNRAVRAYARQ